MFQEQTQLEQDRQAERSAYGFTLDSQMDIELSQVVTSKAEQKQINLDMVRVAT